MRIFFKRSLEKFLKGNIPFFYKEVLIKILYRIKGINLYRIIQTNPFFIYNIDDYYLPTESLFWNITKDQLSINNQNIGLKYFNLQKGNGLIDIGAGFGEDLVTYVDLFGEDGHLICIEPLPQAHFALSQLVKFNQYNNVDIYSYALSDKNEKVFLNSTDDYEATFITKSHKNGTYVDGIRFDALMEKINYKEIDFIKVNIEGAERFLLEDAFVPYFKRIKHLAIACHDFRYSKENNDFFKTKSLVIDFFKKHNFKIKQQNTGEDWIDDWVYLQFGD